MTAMKLKRARFMSFLLQRCRFVASGLGTMAVVGLAACGGGSGAGTAPVVAVDGSSTVFPIAEAVAEEYQAVEPTARVTVGVSGTGGGFKKFCAGEIDIADASRPIKGVEIEACEAAGVEFIELPIAYDGIAVVVHPDNDWVNILTPEVLKRMWEPMARLPPGINSTPIGQRVTSIFLGPVLTRERSTISRRRLSERKPRVAVTLRRARTTTCWCRVSRRTRRRWDFLAMPTTRRIRGG